MSYTLSDEVRELEEQVERERERHSKRIHEIYGAAGVPTPSTALIPWLECLRRSHKILDKFHTWLMEETHRREAALLRLEEEGYDAIFWASLKEETNLYRTIFNKLVQMSSEQ